MNPFRQGCLGGINTKSTPLVSDPGVRPLSNWRTHDQPKGHTPFEWAHGRGLCAGGVAFGFLGKIDSLRRHPGGELVAEMQAQIDMDWRRRPGPESDFTGDGGTVKKMILG